MEETFEYCDEDLQGLTRDELIHLYKKVLEENKRYKKIIDESQKKPDNSQRVEFVSFGSSNVMFLNGEDLEKQKYLDHHHHHNNNNNNNNNNQNNDSNNDPNNQQNVVGYDRRNGSLHVPNVSDYRNLFKKSVILEYEADSPSFRAKVDHMVCRNHSLIQ